MDEDRKQKITELAKRAYRAERLVNAFMMQNVYAFTTEEEREKFSVECALAHAEARDALNELTAAINNRELTDPPEEEITISPGWPLL